MTVVDKAGMETLTQIAFENYAEFLRLAFERDGIAGVIKLSERLVGAAKEFGFENGAATDDVTTHLVAKLFPEFNRELYGR